MINYKLITDYPDYYINSVGQVISSKKGNSKVLKGNLTKGYKAVRLRKDKTKMAIMIHRLVALYFIPNPENKPFVNHINGIKDDNRVENLEWCTQSENVIHAYKNNLCPSRKGELNGRATVSEKIVSDIRKIKDRSISQIARDYNISWDCVNKIVKHKTWLHVS